MRFIIDKHSSGMVLPSTTKVTVAPAFQLKQGHHMIGSVDCVYDFKDVPPQYIELLLQLVHQTTVVHLAIPGIEESIEIKDQLQQREMPWIIRAKKKIFGNS